MRTTEQELQSRLNVNLTQQDVDAYEHFCSVSDSQDSVDEYLATSDLLCEVCDEKPNVGLFRDNDNQSLHRLCVSCKDSLEHYDSADFSEVENA